MLTSLDSLKEADCDVVSDESVPQPTTAKIAKAKMLISERFIVVSELDLIELLVHKAIAVPSGCSYKNACFSP